MGRAQRRLRFAPGRRGAAHGAEARPIRLQGAGAAFAFGLCLLPVLLGFVRLGAFDLVQIGRVAKAGMGLP